MGKFNDISNKKFSRLTVIERDDHKNALGKERVKNGEIKSNPPVFWKCICDCGKEVTVSGTLLRNGVTKSCGCLQVEKVILKNISNKGVNSFEEKEDYYIGFNLDATKSFKISKEDYDAISRNYWGFHTNSKYWYCKELNIWMHQFVSENKVGKYDKNTLEPDHLNRDRGDNRRENLELKTRSDNMKNRGLQSNNKTGVKGVYYDKVKGKYIAHINIDKKHVYLGTFKTLEEAKLKRIEYEKKNNYIPTEGIK